VVQSQHVAELHQEQQHRGHVLEAGHHGMRRELDQRAEPHQPEQRLKRPAEQDDGEEHQQRGRHAGLATAEIAMQQGKKQQAEEERRGDPWRINTRGAVAKHDAHHAGDDRRDQSRHRAIGKVFVAEADEGEHAERHRERDGDGR
jgi:hypothetical protein